MSAVGWDKAQEINPGAVHGKFVPGLPWDTLPKPRWISDSPVPEMVERFEDLCSQAEEAEDRAQELESEADDERAQADKLRAEAETLLSEIEAADGSKGAQLREEFAR